MEVRHEFDIVEIASEKQNEETRREDIPETPGLLEGIQRPSDEILHQTEG